MKQPPTSLVMLLTAQHAIRIAREIMKDNPKIVEAGLHHELAQVESSLALITTLTEACENDELTSTEPDAVKIESIFSRAFEYMRNKKMVVMSLFAAIVLTGCATHHSSMKIDKDCKKTLTCLVEEGERCTQVRLETQGACRIDFAGLNEIY